MPSEKLTGYALLAAGLLIIFFSAFSVHQVFTKKASPAELFSFTGISVDVGIADQELISPQMINQSSNIFAHFLLMGFVASIGYKVANIGAQLIRPIEVKLKQSDIINKQ